MMSPELRCALAGSAAVSLTSLAGVASLPFDPATVRGWLGPAVGLAAGALIGDAVLHLLPETLADPAGPAWVLVGLAFSFTLEKVLRWHHEPCAAGHEHEHGVKPTGAVLLAGCGLHNAVDGALIGASFLHSVPLGMTTTTAVLLHELPHEVGDFAVLLDCGYSRGRALLYNFLTACLALAGTVLVFACRDVLRHSSAALAVTAGQFLYVALAGLFPELQKERAPGRSLLQVLALGAGVGLMAALKKLG